MKLVVLSLLLVVAALAAPIEKKEEVVEKKEVNLVAEPVKTEEPKKEESKPGKCFKKIHGLLDLCFLAEEPKKEEKAESKDESKEDKSSSEGK